MPLKDWTEQCPKGWPGETKNICGRSKVTTRQLTRELYAEERSVIRDLCFAENLDKKEKTEAFAHERTKYPSSLFIPDALQPNRFAMRKGNKSDYSTMLETTMGSEWKESGEEPANDHLKTSYFIELMAFLQRYQSLGLGLPPSMISLGNIYKRFLNWNHYIVILCMWCRIGMIWTRRKAWRLKKECEGKCKKEGKIIHSTWQSADSSMEGYSR